jgi:AcrR family transcriptional regulator
VAIKVEARTARTDRLSGQAQDDRNGREARAADAQTDRSAVAGAEAAPEAPADGKSPERYRRLPTGAHGLAREEVARDQRDRLQRAMTELISARGYQAVRILDLTQLAHVSRPTFYELYADKEELLLSAYNDIAARTAETVLEAFNRDRKSDLEARLRAGMHAFATLAPRPSRTPCRCFCSGRSARGRRRSRAAKKRSRRSSTRSSQAAIAPAVRSWTT